MGRGHVLLAAARRLVIISAAVVGATVLVSALFALVGGSSLQRSIAVGFYVAGALLLAGCFVIGVRGPMRGVSKSGDTVSLLGARRVRRATDDERSEAARTSILLFCLGLLLVVLGTVVDPARTVI